MSPPPGSAPLVVQQAENSELQGDTAPSSQASQPPAAFGGDGTALDANLSSWLDATAEAGPPDQPPPAVSEASSVPGHTLLQRLAQATLVPAQPVPDFRRGERRCDACCVLVSGQHNWELHLASKRHAARVQRAATAAIAAAEPNPQQHPSASSTGPAGPPSAAALLAAPSSAHNGRLGSPNQAAPYVDQMLSPELNTAVEALLRQLLEWQSRVRRLDPANARRKRRLVSGMREVHKMVKTRKAKLLVVAPNVGVVAAPEREGGGRDGEGPAAEEGAGGEGDEAEGSFPLAPALALCQEHGVPVVFALSRRRLGKVLGQRKMASAFAVVDAAGAEGQVREVLRLAEEGRRQWAAAKGAG